MYKDLPAVITGQTYTISMYVKLGTATNFAVVPTDVQTWNSIGGKTFTTGDGLTTTGWKKISYTYVSPNGANRLHIGAHSASIAQQTAGTVYIR